MVWHDETTAFYRKRLPHWEVLDGAYFITICQQGAIPQKALLRIRRINEQLKQANDNGILNLQRMIYREIENSLAETRKAGILCRPNNAYIICEAIRHREKHGVWKVIEFSLMPNHLHLFISGLASRLDPAITDLKRWISAKIFEIHEMQSIPNHQLWQREWFDHWSRSIEETQKIIRYIRDNPVKAGYVDDYRRWPFGSWNFK